jgi:GntR family transcriptional regulator
MQVERILPPDIFRVATGTSEPIYRQLIQQLRRLIAAGQVRAEDAMPSVREVASALGVNPMTVSKAYSMLESEGFLRRRRGLGMVVAAVSAELIHHDCRLELLQPDLQRIALEVKQLELEHTAVIGLFERILKENS